MTIEHGAMKGEDAFFNALLRGDGTALKAVLTFDFLLIDVMSGSEIPGDVLVDLVGSRQLRFESVERIDSRLRQFGDTAIVTGQTRMRVGFGDQRFEAHSRYTHVYVRNEQGWRLASAQGTPIAAAAV
jgi:ketosteroid isomerase-like protein